MDKPGLTLGAMIYPDWEACPLETQIKTLSAADLRYTELFITEKSLPHVAAVAQAVRRAGIEPISLHAPFSREISLSTLDTPRREISVTRGLAAVEAAAAVGCKTIIFHPANDVRNVPLQGEYAAALTESMQRLCEAAQPHGLRAAIENMPPGELGASLFDLAEVVGAAGIPNLGVCLDTGHAHMMNELFIGLPAIAPWLLALHVHDNNRAQDQHLAVFSGTIPWGGFMHWLHRNRFQGCFMLETGSLFPRKEDPNPSLDWLERLRGELDKRWT